MAKYSVESTTLTGIADAIREKTGSSEKIKVEDMADKVANLPDAGSGSGAGIETCTVEIIVGSGCQLNHLTAITKSETNNNIEIFNITTYLEDTTITIPNVLCNSIIISNCRVPDGVLEISQLSNAELLYTGYEGMGTSNQYHVFNITALPYETTTIKYRRD